MSDGKQHRQTWFTTGLTKGGIQRVDTDAHALRGVTLANVGEAKGHGLWLDGVFLDSIRDGVKGKANGLKARLSHPGMCNDGTGSFLGKVKLAQGKQAAFRGGPVPDGDAGGVQRYDLFLSSAAEDAPGKGDIRGWVETMASEHPDMVGFSVVFRRDLDAEDDFHVANGAKKGSDAEDLDMSGFKSPDPANTGNLPHARLAHLHAADIVDDPAATDGLFSEGSSAALADQMTEYLDLHPQIFEALKLPMIQEALLNYADRLAPFLAKYAANKQGETAMENKTMTTPETPITAAAVAAPAPTAAAVPAAAPVPVVPDALAVAMAQIAELQVSLKAEQDKVAALSKGEIPLSAGAAPDGKKKVPATFWAKE